MKPFYAVIFVLALTSAVAAHDAAGSIEQLNSRRLPHDDVITPQPQSGERDDKIEGQPALPCDGVPPAPEGCALRFSGLAHF